MAILEAQCLKKIYTTRFGSNQVQALSNVSFSVEEGEYVAIMGPSGSGKTTLMNIIGCLDKPTSGTYELAGEDVMKLKDKELSDLRLKRIGFVFQQFHLLPVLTARENILMPLLLDRKKEDRAYLGELAELLGISGRLTHLPHELSGGQQQRVAIARALIARPDIIFADEPTGNLDSKSGGEVMRLLAEIRRRMKKTLVVITHDSQIAQMADRRFVIMDGMLSEEGVTIR